MWYLKANLKFIRQTYLKRNSVLKFSNFVNTNKKFAISDNFAGYKVESSDFIDELQCEAYLLKHTKTGSEHLHINRKNDKNNAFSVLFRTTPKDDTGVAHILEHLVLCGSKQYPVRDPFFKMLNRSLATFMNAMTSPDCTMYPFSTQNETDYRNLMKIYTDAVFSPQLDKRNFEIEGWRLEHDQVNDAQSPIIFKGIVFNEMKGSFSEKDNLVFQNVLNYLLPDHAYKYMYGGHPLHIPNLTYAQLRQFHEFFYHPSNAKFFTYGSFPLDDTLSFLNEEYLSKFDQLDCSNTMIPLQKNWTCKRQETIKVPMDNLMKEKPYSMAIAYKTNDISNLYENCIVEFLSELLLSGLNAPLYKSLIESGNATAFSPSSGYISGCRNGIFLVGLQGINNTESIEESITLFDKSLNEIIENGFEMHHIEATQHKFELSLQQEKTNKGLELIQSIGYLWNHGANPIEALHRRELFAKLFKEIEQNPKFLQDKLLELFIKNTHRLELSFVPDENYEAELEKAEANLLKQKLESMNEDDRKLIYENGLLLQKHLNDVQNHSSVLPCLRLEDISTDIEKITINELNANKNFWYCLSPTNDLIYFHSLIDISNLTLDQQLLLPLFVDFITKLATEKFEHKQLDSLISKKSSGFNLSVSSIVSLNNLNDFRTELSLGSFCLKRNFLDMMDIWCDLFKPRHLDAPKGHLETLLQLYMSDLSNGIMYNGHRYAMLAAASFVSKSALFDENMSGLKHIDYVQDFLKTYLNNPSDLLQEFEQILNKLTNQRSLFTLSSENNLNLMNDLENFVNDSKSMELNKFELDTNIADKVKCLHYVVPNSPVYYCSKAIATVPFVHKDYAPLVVLSKYLTTRYLHPVLREKQGAYGGGLHFTDGILQFYSYRDPENRKTLNTFDNCHSWFLNELENGRDISKQELLEAKLGVFQKVDAIIEPGCRGLSHFVRNLTYEDLKDYRLRILNVTSSDLKRVLQNYLLNNRLENMSKVILGPELDSSVYLNDEDWKILKQN